MLMPDSLNLPQRAIVDDKGVPSRWFASLLKETIDNNAALANLTGNLDNIDDGATRVGFLPSERTKLGAIEDNATADQTSAEILALWESETSLDDADLVVRDGTRSFTGPVQFPIYTVASAPSAGAAGRVIYVANGDAGSPCLAVDNGFNWLRVTLGATISPT